MKYSIYTINLELKERNEVDFITNYSKMNLWLKNNGDKNSVYELWKNNRIKSRWFYKLSLNRWQRMPTIKYD